MIVKRLVVGALQTNCYVIASGGAGAVIDPGADPGQILKVLEENAVRLKYIITTHGHFDHVEALQALADATGAVVCSHNEDQGSVTAGRSVKDGDVILLDSFELKILHTPGHTPGSISILAGDMLFSGDLIFRGSVGRTDLPGGSWPQLSESLRRISGLGDSLRIFPGHGPESSIGEEKAHNPFLQDLER